MTCPPQAQREREEAEERARREADRLREEQEDAIRRAERQADEARREEAEKSRKLKEKLEKEKEKLEKDAEEERQRLEEKLRQETERLARSKADELEQLTQEQARREAELKAQQVGQCAAVWVGVPLTAWRRTNSMLTSRRPRDVLPLSVSTARPKKTAVRASRRRSAACWKRLRSSRVSRDSARSSRR